MISEEIVYEENRDILSYDYYSYSANVGIIIDFKSLKKEKLL